MLAILLAMLGHAGEPVLLDFGPEDGEVLDGFSEITPFQSAHPAATWVKPPRDARRLSWLDPLADDQARGGTLHLDLPPGDYAIAGLFQERGFWYQPHSQVKSGLVTDAGWVLAAEPASPEAFFSDPTTQGVRRPRFTPGGSAWDRQIAPAIRWRTDRFQVEEGGIDLEIRGRDLSALAIFPGGDVAALEVELALLDASRQRAWLERTAVWTAPDAVATEGLVGLERVPFDAWPSPDPQTVEAVDVVLAPGERRVLQFAVHGSDASAQVGVEGLGPVGTALYELDWLDVKVSKRITRPTPHILRPLPDGAGLDGGQGLVPMLAVELSVPVGAEPGLHSGTMSVARDGERIELPLRVRVRDLKLAEAPVPWGFWSDLRGPIASVYGPNSEVAKRRWAAGVSQMRRWGVERVSIRGAVWPATRLTADDAEVQFERIRWAVQTFRGEAGAVPDDVQWHDPKFNLQNQANLDPARPFYDERAAALLGKVFELSAELDVSLYVSDEETMHYGPGHAPILAARFAAMRELSGDVELNIASPHPGGWVNAAALGDRVYVTAQPQIDPSHRESFEGGRADYWAYNLGWHREASGALPWLLEVEGLLIWHFNDATSAPFNELDRRRRFAVVMPGEDPGDVWASRRLIRLGHGGFDQRYYGTLANLVEELDGRRRPAIQRALDHACLLLDTAGAGMVGLRFDSFDDHPLRDSRSLQALQDEVGDTAEVLARWSKRQRNAGRGREELGRGGWSPARCRGDARPISPHANPADVPPPESE